jgi:hypothetical protein
MKLNHRSVLGVISKIAYGLSSYIADEFGWPFWYDA